MGPAGQKDDGRCECQTQSLGPASQTQGKHSDPCSLLEMPEIYLIKVGRHVSGLAMLLFLDRFFFRPAMVHV